MKSLKWLFSQVDATKTFRWISVSKSRIRILIQNWVLKSGSKTEYLNPRKFRKIIPNIKFKFVKHVPNEVYIPSSNLHTKRYGKYSDLIDLPSSVIKYENKGDLITNTMVLGCLSKSGPNSRLLHFNVRIFE